MNKMLVGVFEREAAAFEGLSALKDLHRDGDITLYSSAVIAKDKNGKIEVKQAAELRPSRHRGRATYGQLDRHHRRACRDGCRSLAWQLGGPDLRSKQEWGRRDVPG